MHKIHSSLIPHVHKHLTLAICRPGKYRFFYLIDGGGGGGGGCGGGGGGATGGNDTPGLSDVITDD